MALAGLWVYVLLCFASSVATARHPQLWVCWMVLGMCVVRVWRCRVSLLWRVCLGAVLCGALVGWHSMQRSSHLTVSPQQEGTVAVMVAPGDWEVSGDRLRVRGTVLDETVEVHYRLSTEAEHQRWVHEAAGGVLTVRGVWRSPESARNWEQFDYRQYLRDHGIFWIMEAEQMVSWQPQAPTLGTLWRYWRQIVLVAVRQWPYEGLRQVTQAFVFADRDGFSPQEQLHWQALGIGYLFSISAAAVHALLYGVRRICWRLGVTRERTESVALVVALLAVLGSLASIGTVKVFLLQVMRLLRRKGVWSTDPLDDLSLVAVLVLCWHGAAIDTLAFQLSFGLHILFYLVPKQQAWWQRTVLVFGYTAPLLAFHHFRVSLVPLLFGWALVAVFLCVLVPLSWGGLCVFLAVPDVWRWCAPWVEWGTQLLLTGVRTSEGWRWLSVVTGRPADWLLALYAVAFLWWLLRGRCSFWLWGVALLALCFGPYLNPYGQVMMLDVGQGDSFLIQTPFNRETILIDTGGQLQFAKEAWAIRPQLSFGEQTVLPILWAHGVDRLDALVLTHSDLDHIGALSDLASWMPVRHVVFGSGADQVPLAAKGFQELARRGSRFSDVVAPANVSVGQLTLQILHPTVPGSGENEHSVVFAVAVNRLNWLFTGDLGIPEEQALLQRGVVPQVDVLKVGHHGSADASSPQWLQATRPQVALISVGRNNRYGHPTQQVLDLLAQQTVYRTDQHGAVRYRYHFLSSAVWETMLWPTNVIE